jgi:hypothetical protein
MIDMEKMQYSLDLLCFLCYSEIMAIKTKVCLNEIRNMDCLPKNARARADTLGGSPADWGRILKGTPAGGQYARILHDVDRWGIEYISECDARQRAIRGGYSDDRDYKPILHPVYLRKRDISARFGGK